MTPRFCLPRVLFQRESLIGVFSVALIRGKKRKRDLCDRYHHSNHLKEPSTMKLCRRKLKLASPSEHKISHLECMKFHSKACNSCIHSICLNMKMNKDHSDNNWYHQVQDTILRDKQLLSYVGHCCEIKASIDKCVKNINPPLNCSENIELRYNGYLHLPELGILIPPPIVRYVDVHGFRKEENSEVPGLLHGVIGRDCANECSISDIVSDEKDSDLISHEYKGVNMRDISRESVMFQYVIVYDE